MIFSIFNDDMNYDNLLKLVNKISLKSKIKMFVQILLYMLLYKVHYYYYFKYYIECKENWIGFILRLSAKYINRIQ